MPLIMVNLPKSIVCGLWFVEFVIAHLVELFYSLNEVSEISGADQ